jgi:fibronectin-binding autotransporter adhesin
MGTPILQSHGTTGFTMILGYPDGCEMPINFTSRARFGSRPAKPGLRLLVLALGLVLFEAGSLRGQTTLFWDINGATAGATNTTLATGTWDDATTAFWTTNSGGTVGTQLWSATAGNKIASFSAGTNASGAFTVTVNGTVTNVAGLVFDEGTVTLGGTGTLTLVNTPTITVNSGNASIGAVLGGAVGFSKAGSGTLTLSGANTYTGATTVSAGVLNIRSNTALGTTANGTTVNSGAALQLQNGITVTGEALAVTGTGISNDGALRNISGNNTWTGAVSLTGATRINSDAGTLTLSGGISATNRALTVGGAGNTAISGAIATGSGTLTKDGAGTLTLSGANTYTGATTVGAGNLVVASAGALGTSANTGTITVASGASLQLSGGVTPTTAGSLVLNSNGGGAGALRNNSGNNTWNTAISLNTDSTIYSATAGNTLNLGTDYTAAPTFTLGSHTLTIDGPGDVWANVNVGVSGDTGGLIKNGTGKLTLYGYNTFYTGATVVNQGSLDLIVGPFTGAWRGINGSLTIGDNGGAAGTVQVNIASNSYANQISSNSAVTINADGILNVGASTTMGTLTLNGGQVALGGAAVALTPSGAITSNAGSGQTALISDGQLALNGSAITVARDTALTSDLTISSVLTGTTLNKQGAGVLTLSGANTYTGGTNVNAGTLRLGASERLADAGAVAIASGATFDLNSYTETIGALTGAGTIRLGGGTLTVGSGTFSGAFAGSDTGTFGKTGAGTLTLGSGLNLSGGTLQLSGGTLNLGGYTSTFGNLLVTASSILDFGTSGSSILNILNTLTVNTGVTLTIANWTDTVDYFYSLLNPGSTNLGNIVFTGYTGPSTKWQPYDHQITPVPEAPAYGAILFGLTALLAFWRRRARA